MKETVLTLNKPEEIDIFQGENLNHDDKKRKLKKINQKSIFTIFIFLF